MGDVHEIHRSHAMQLCDFADTVARHESFFELVDVHHKRRFTVNTEVAVLSGLRDDDVLHPQQHRDGRPLFLAVFRVIDGESTFQTVLPAKEVPYQRPATLTEPDVITDRLRARFTKIGWTVEAKMRDYMIEVILHPSDCPPFNIGYKHFNGCFDLEAKLTDGGSFQILLHLRGAHYPQAVIDAFEHEFK